MPIYAYRCQSCGFAKDVLQKMSDDVLTICPECNQSSFQKQVTAAGFQLKGSGWYVTDFRDGTKNVNSSNSTNAKSPETAASKTESTNKDVTSSSTETKVTSTSATSNAGCNSQSQAQSSSSSSSSSINSSTAT